MSVRLLAGGCLLAFVFFVGSDAAWADPALPHPLFTIAPPRDAAPPGASYSRSLSVAPDGRIVALYDRVYVLSSDGRTLEAWGGYGLEEGLFPTLPAVVAGRDDDVYVWSWSLGRLERFSMAGQLLGSSGGWRRAPHPSTGGTFLVPEFDGGVITRVLQDRTVVSRIDVEAAAGNAVSISSMDETPAGDLVVLDGTHQETLRLSPDGELLARWSMPANLPWYTQQIAAAGDRVTWVLYRDEDLLNERILAFDASGRQVADIPAGSPTPALDLSGEPDGSVLVRRPSDVVRLMPDGSAHPFLQALRVQAGYADIEANAEGGSVALVSTGDRAIVFDTDGERLREVRLDALTALRVRAVDLALLPGASLAVRTSGGENVVLSPDGQTLVRTLPDYGYSFVGTPAGLFMADAIAGRVTLVDVNGTVLKRWEGHGPVAGMFVGSIVMGRAPDGGVLVTDGVSQTGRLTLRSRVQLLLPDGSARILFDYALDDAFPLRTHAYAGYGTVPPTSIAGTPDGSVIIANREEQAMAVFDRSGSLLGRLDHSDLRDPGYAPVNLAVDALGRLLAVDSGGSIRIFGPPTTTWRVERFDNRFQAGWPDVAQVPGETESFHYEALLGTDDEPGSFRAETHVNLEPGRYRFHLESAPVGRLRAWVGFQLVADVSELEEPWSGETDLFIRRPDLPMAIEGAGTTTAIAFSWERLPGELFTAYIPQSTVGRD